MREQRLCHNRQTWWPQQARSSHISIWCVLCVSYALFVFKKKYMRAARFVSSTLQQSYNIICYIKPLLLKFRSWFGWRCWICKCIMFINFMICWDDFWILTVKFVISSKVLCSWVYAVNHSAVIVQSTWTWRWTLWRFWRESNRMHSSQGCKE